MELKEAYKIMAKASGIEKGDTVKILRGFAEDELGEMCGGAERSAQYIGQTGTITDIHEFSMGFQVTFPSDKSFYFPWFVLEKVDKPHYKFKVGDTVRVSGRSIANDSALDGKIGKIFDYLDDTHSYNFRNSYVVGSDELDVYGLCFHPEQLTLVTSQKFQVGDWVKVSGNSVLKDSRFDGKVCKVVKYCDETYDIAEFRNTYGLECLGVSPAKLFFKPEQLTLADEPKDIEVKIGHCRCFRVSRSTAASLIKQLEGC